MAGIHVLHVLNSAHGGSAISTLELIEALKARGVKSSLVCFNNADEQQRKTISDLVEGRVLFIPLYWMNKRIRVAWWKRPLLELANLWKTWGGYRFQAKISSFIRSNGVNVIHTSTILNPEGALAAKKHKLPHIWHVRELIGQGMYFQFPLMKMWVSFVQSHASVLVANSSITHQHLKHFFDSIQIETIPNGIEVNSYKVKFHQHVKPVVVGMIGNVTSRLKNHEFFIRTALSLKGDEEVEWRIYGALPHSDDPYYQALKQQAHATKGIKIVFCGHKNPIEIVNQIDILFHPTPFESFGRVFIEAMAAGIPVIGVKGGGAEEVIREGENGFLVLPDDVGMAAKRIQQLLASAQLRSAFGAAGRQLVEQRYTLDHLAESMQKLYFRYSIKSA